MFNSSPIVYEEEDDSCDSGPLYSSDKPKTSSEPQSQVSEAVSESRTSHDVPCLPESDSVSLFNQTHRSGFELQCEFSVAQSLQ